MTPIVEPLGMNPVGSVTNGGSVRVPKRGGYDSYTVTLLHMDGSNGSTVFSDAIGRSWTTYGSAKLATTPTKFGSSVGDFRSGCIVSANSTDFTFNTGAFTFDFWIYFAATAGTQTIFYRYVDDNNYFKIQSAGGTLLIKCIVGGTTLLDTQSSSACFSATTWYHVAIVRDVNAATVVYVGGNTVTLTTATSSAGKDLANIAVGFYIGATWSGDTTFNAYMDEFRVSKGIARWTSPFTPPNAAY